MAGKVRTSFVRLMVLAVLAALVFLGLAAFRVGPAPAVGVYPEFPGIGRATPVKITVEEPVRGLSRFRVELVQNERVEVLEDRGYPHRKPWEFWGHRVSAETLTVAVGTETVKGLREGKATVRVVAYRAEAWLRWPAPTTVEIELPVLLRPPTLQVMSTHTYVAQGGCEAVVYRVGETAVEDGIQAGDWWFPGFRLPGGDEQDRFALFSVPYDVSDIAKVQLLARDAVGNQSNAAFIDRFFARPPKSDTIGLSTRFLERVVPPIMAQTPDLEDQGSPLANYLLVNRQLRKRNRATLVELAGASVEEFTWTREFMQMRNAKVMSGFADRRTYLYEGEAVDQQDHLGFDLASTAQSPIEASNDGIVVLARYFGIYGNAVIIDHGYGVMSLYGHLSSIDVQEQQPVERGQQVGRSGATGLAGGDHLHFAILLHGLPVNPTEWWDSHWIHDRLKLKLGAAIPFQGGS